MFKSIMSAVILILAGLSSPALAQSDTRMQAASTAFERAKPRSAQGQTRRNGRIECLVYWMGWAKFASLNDENIALYNPEFGFAFATEQFNVYYGRVFAQDWEWSGLDAKINEGVNEFINRMNATPMDMDAFARDIGRCYVRVDVREHPDNGPIDPLSIFATVTGTQYDDTLFFNRSGNAYVQFAGNVGVGSYAQAANIAYNEIQRNGYRTITEGELKTVASAALTTGEAHLMSANLREQLAEAYPRELGILTRLPGGGGSSSSAQFGEMRATATSGLMGSATAASSDASRRATVMVNDRCRAIGGAPVSTRTVPDGPTRQATSATYRATATAITRCEPR